MNIRNFVIIAHIDHGKSTLADRMLEVTGTIEHRKMKAQFLDQLELEQERGITIKMAPVRMVYNHSDRGSAKVKNEYILNLIDTPGHPDFGYEVSRALEAVEGAILLVDGTQGIQAQTLSNFWAAKKAGLTIIGAVNKVDLNIPDIDRSVLEVAELLGVSPDAVHKISGKTGQGVDELLEDVVRLVPSPAIPPTAVEIASEAGIGRALIFDSLYDDHQGIVAAVRVMDGTFGEGQSVSLLAVRQTIKAKEVGYFIPRMKASSSLHEGEIGYIVTGLKDPNKIKIGDTMIYTPRPITDKDRMILLLPGYREPKPVVFVSFFPDEADEFDDLKKALERLRLNDSAFVFEPDYNEVLGRGFKGGFLGKLHFEIVSQRLEREFDVETVTSFPSVAYKVKTDALTKSGLEKDGDYVVVKNPADLPAEYDHILEPMIQVEIIAPNTMVGNIVQLQQLFRWQNVETQNLHDRVIITTTMPLAELISDFDDKLKSISGGFASFSYHEAGYQRFDLVRLDMMVAGELVPGLSRVVPREDAERLGRSMAGKLKTTLPQQQFTQAIQAYSMGRIIARETIPAMKKDVTGYLYGGDRTRKMKLWKKQKEGKKKLKAMGRVTITAQDFKKLLEK